MLTREHMAEPTLLIVEPDEGTRAVMERDLRHRYGDRYRVLTAVSEDEALGTLDRLNAAQEPLALLLVAQRLPKATGVEFLQQASPRVPRAKRVLVTTFEDAEAAIDAIKTVRIDHYLVKPWQPPELHHYPVLDDLLADWEAAVRPPLPGPCVVVGYRFSPQSYQTRDFLVRHCVPFQWLDLERDEEARRLLFAAGVQASRLPIVRFPDGHPARAIDEHYLIEQIEATKNVKVRLRTSVVEAHGEQRLEAITVLDATTGEKETLPTTATASS